MLRARLPSILKNGSSRPGETPQEASIPEAEFQPPTPQLSFKTALTPVTRKVTKTGSEASSGSSLSSPSDEDM